MQHRFTAHGASSFVIAVCSLMFVLESHAAVAQEPVSSTRLKAITGTSASIPPVQPPLPSPATNEQLRHQDLTVHGKARIMDDSDSMSAPNNISTKIMPAVPVAVEENKPKKGFFHDVLTPLKEHGITFHALILDNFVSNVVGGVKPGTRLQNALGVIQTQINLEKLLGWKGAQINFGEDIFFLRNNDNNWSQQVGDSIVGYQPPHLFRGNYLSELTLDQKLLNNKLEIEGGRANISRYFLVPNCNQILTCFKDVWSQDAGISTFVYATWSGHIVYHFTPSWYFQAAATEVNKTVYFTNGWEWDTQGASGATGVGEVGYNRGFDKTAYPSMFEFLGFYNSSTVTDPIKTVAGTSQLYDKSSPAQTHTGMSGIFFSGQQYVWRKDHGTSRNPHGMALAVYGGAGSGFQTYAPVQAEAYLGAFVQAPFASHPLDSYGIQLHWTKLGSREEQFLAEANKLSGGDGKRPNAAHLVVDVHAHTFLFPNVALEPSLQYVINPNTYYAPMTREHPHNALEVGATLFVYLDKMLAFP